MFDYTPVALNNWVLYAFKNIKLVSFFIILEYLSFWTECVNTVTRRATVYSDYLTLSKLNNANPLDYLQNTIITSSITDSECTSTTCSFSNVSIVVLASLIILFLGLHHFITYFQYQKYLKNDISQISDAKSRKIIELFFKVFINIIDFTFKTLSIFLYYIFINKVFIGLYFKNDYTYVIISILFLVTFTFMYYFQVKYILLYLKLDHQGSLQYDSFSQQYDYTFLVIKILIATNKNLLLINKDDKFNHQVACIDYLIIFFIFYFTLKMTIELISNKNLVIITNLKLNLIRLFLAMYLCVYIVLFAFFNLLLIYEILLINFAALFITCCFITWITAEIYEFIYNDFKFLYQLSYLLDIFLQNPESENIYFQNEAIKIQSLHSTNCTRKVEKKKCSLCEFDYLKNNPNQENNVLEKLKIISGIFLYIESNTYEELSPEEQNYFNFMNLIYNYSLSSIDPNIPQFKIIYKAKEMIEKNKIRRDTYYFNLVFYYSRINKQTELNLKKFKVVEKYDSSLNKLRKSVDILIEMVNTINSKVKKDLYPQTNELNKLKNSISENLQEIHATKNLYNEIFSFVMTKYIFEKTFNIDMNSTIDSMANSEDFDYRQDLVDDRFFKDSILVINYKVEQDLLYLTRASKKFLGFQGKFFEDIFPTKYKLLGKQKFLQAIQSNNEEFTFEFLVETNNNFVKNLKLDCKIFRSFNLKDLFIYASYEFTKDELIIFEAPSVYDPNNQIQVYDIIHGHLVSFSESLEKILFINPFTVDYFLKSKNFQKKKLLFSDIFRKTTFGLEKNSLSAKIETNGAEYVLVYKNYFNNFFAEIEKHKWTIEDEDIITKINDLKEYSYGNVIKNVKLFLKYTIVKDENSEFCIYNLQLQKSRKNKNTNFRKGNIEIDIDSSLFEAHLKDTQYVYEGSQASQPLNSQFGGTAFSSTATTSSLLKNQSGIFKGKKGLLDGENNMDCFTISTLLINVCLVIYCIVFLVIGFTSKDKLNELNNIKSYFINFERYFYQTSLSLLYNIEIHEQGDSQYKSSNYFDEFKSPNVKFQISFAQYANSELQFKVDLLKVKLAEMQNYIYASSFKQDLTPVFNFDTNMKVITLTGIDMLLSDVKTNFIDSISMFLNNVKGTDVNSKYTKVYIFNYNINTGDYDFSSIKNRNFSGPQKAVYELIFNYPNYYNNMNKIWGDIQGLFQSQVDSIFNLNFCLSLILIGLHVFLLIVSLAIINFLKNITEQSNFILCKIITGDWTSYLNMKYVTLRDMTIFYKIDPIKASGKLRKEQRDSAKIIREKNRKEEKMIETLDENEFSNNSNPQIVIGNLTSPLMQVLVYLFSFYLIYAFSFILIFNNSNKDILLSSEYTSYYMEVEKDVVNSLILLETNMLSNQTDINLNKYLAQSSDFIYQPPTEQGYVMNLIEEMKLHNKLLTIKEDRNINFKNLEKQANLLCDCDYLYKNINDEIFSASKKLFEDDSTLFNNLVTLCKQFPMMSKNSIKNLIEDLNYSTMKLTRAYLESNGDYDKIKKIKNEKEFYDIFTINLMILRPLQNYIIQNYILSIILGSEEYFMVCVTAFMIGNFMVECLIFIIINRKLIRRVSNINDEIRCLTICLTA
jgi:hypothetical protein